MALSLIFFSTQLHEITRPPRSKEEIHSRDSWRAGISTSYSMSPDIAAPSLHSAATSSYEALGCHTRRSNKSIQSTRASTKRGQLSYLEAEATLRVNVPAICQSFSTYSRVVQEYRSAHRRVQSFLLLNNRDLSWIAFYHSYKLLQRILLKCLRICWTY